MGEPGGGTPPRSGVSGGFGPRPPFTPSTATVIQVAERGRRPRLPPVRGSTNPLPAQPPLTGPHEKPTSQPLGTLQPLPFPFPLGQLSKLSFQALDYNVRVAHVWPSADTAITVPRVVRKRLLASRPPTAGLLDAVSVGCDTASHVAQGGSQNTLGLPEYRGQAVPLVILKVAHGGGYTIKMSVTP